MVNRVENPISNPPELPEGVFVGLAHFLDKKDLNAFSLVSKTNYNTIYKAAIEAQLTGYKAQLPPRLLTLDETSRPYAAKATILGKNDDWVLLEKRRKNIAFAADPRNQTEVALLNTTFPERVCYAKDMEPKREELAKIYHKWLKEEVFVGSRGLDFSVFLDNVRNLIQRYRESRDPSILQMLRQGQSVSPSETLSRVIDLLVENPRVDPFEQPDFRAFEAAVENALNEQHLVQEMKTVKDAFSHALDAREEDAFQRWRHALAEALSSRRVLFSASSQTLAALMELSVTEVDTLKEVLTFSLHLLAPMQHGLDIVDQDPQLTFSAHIHRVKGLVSTFQSTLERHSALLARQDQHTRVLWGAILSDDRESLRCLIDSPALLYFRWEKILNEVLRREQPELFLHLISYPQVVKTLSLNDFQILVFSFLEEEKLRAPTGGWDMIAQTAEAHPSLWLVLGGSPFVAVHMPQDLRDRYLAPELRLHAAGFQAFFAPQEGNIRSVAESMGRLMTAYPELVDQGRVAMQEKCSFPRRIALVSQLPRFLSPELVGRFYDELPAFYKIICFFSVVFK